MLCDIVRWKSGCELPSGSSAAVPVESRITMIMPQCVSGIPHGLLTRPPFASQKIVPVCAITAPVDGLTQPASVACQAFSLWPSPVERPPVQTMYPSLFLWYDFPSPPQSALNGAGNCTQSVTNFLPYVVPMRSPTAKRNPPEKNGGMSRAVM